MICHLCGCRLAESDDGLKHHMQRYHAVSDNQPRAKHRPKQEVVAEWEAKHMSYLIFPSDIPQKVKKIAKHEETTCSIERCVNCFNAQLDRLLASTEEGIYVSRTVAGLNHDVSGHEL